MFSSEQGLCHRPSKQGHNPQLAPGTHSTLVLQRHRGKEITHLLSVRVGVWGLWVEWRGQMERCIREASPPPPPVPAARLSVTLFYASGKLRLWDITFSVRFMAKCLEAISLFLNNISGLVSFLMLSKIYWLNIFLLALLVSLDFSRLKKICGFFSFLNKRFRKIFFSGWTKYLIGFSVIFFFCPK